MKPSMTSPFGYIPTSEMPTRPVEWLTFTIPADDMRMSEARAWADFQAEQWATVRATKIVGTIDWRVDGMVISALVPLTSPPSRPRRAGSNAGDPGHPTDCATCHEVAAFEDAPTASIATALNLDARTVMRHRTIPATDRRIKGKP